MNKTITIDVFSEKALDLLQSLAELNLIKIKDSKSKIDTKSKWYELKGSMSSSNIEAINNQLEELRNEW